MSERDGDRRGHSQRPIILLLSVAALCAMMSGCRLAGRGAPPPPVARSAAELESEFTQVAEQVLPAVVRINVEASGEMPGGPQMPEGFREFFRQFPWFNAPEPEGGPGGEEMPREFRREGLGSGWIYSEDGYIVTNAHVVQGATKLTVVLHDRDHDKREYPATVVGTDAKTDLAVLKVDAGRKLPHLALGDSDGLKIASWVMAVGAPFELEQTVTVGVVSAKGRLIEPDPTAPNLRLGDIIQTDASINPGNSGGPLVNLRGEVVGINVAYASPTNSGNIGIGFAIPAATAKGIIPRLIEGRKIARGWLGVGIEDLSENLKQFFGVERGVRVGSIDADGPADKSDLKVDDVITAVGDQQVEDTWDLQRVISEHEPGAAVTLTVTRNKAERKIEVTLGEMPAEYSGAPEAPSKEAPAAPKAPLGITVMPLSDLTPEIGQELGVEAERGRVVGVPATSGALVKSVEPGSMADGKVVPGDVIVKVSGVAVADVKQYQAQMKQALADDRKFVVVHLYRVVAGRAVLHATDIEKR